MNLRQTIYYSGRVQGVCFRATACAVADGFEVTGTVRNLPDGRVELVAEGEAEELQRFTEALGKQMHRYISDRHIHEAPAGGVFDRFEIIY